MNKRLLFFASMTLALGLITYKQLFSNTAQYQPAEQASMQSDIHQSLSESEQFTGKNQQDMSISEPQVLPPSELEDIQTAPAQMTLWHQDLEERNSGSDRMYTTKVNPEQLKQFHVGQTLTFSTPGNNTPINAEIDKTYNQGRFAKVWNASVSGSPEESLTITQGKIETHMVIVSEGAVYTAIIDNKTGETVIVDQADLAEKTIPYEDGVPLPVEQPSLPTL